jgi:hypothetical protein
VALDGGKQASFIFLELANVKRKIQKLLYAQKTQNRQTNKQKKQTKRTGKTKRRETNKGRIERARRIKPYWPSGSPSLSLSSSRSSCALTTLLPVKPPTALLLLTLCRPNPKGNK